MSVPLEIETLLWRISVMGLLEGLLWILPSRPRKVLIYVPAWCLYTFGFGDKHTALALILALVHGFIHHQWPFINEQGYNYQHSPFYDVCCHLVMMIYAHNSFRDKFEGDMLTFVDWCYYFMFLWGVLNCALARELGPDDVNVPCSIRWWFEYTSMSQAFSSAYFMLVLISDLPAGPLWMWAWFGFQFFYLSNWLLFKCLDQAWLGSFFSHDYFALAFIVPSCIGTICSRIR